MSKLYKAFDNDGKLSCFLVNKWGVAVSFHCGDDEREIRLCRRSEKLFGYENIKRFDDAIDPILLAEW
ncbi:MAG: hypothetical protein [Caudoviricetes sp.]|nr:MAG: hypothetical protein [Caudoviricetes sp.]